MHARIYSYAFVGALAACSDSPYLGESAEGLRVNGGWDYNNARWNSAVDGLSIGPVAPYGAPGPNTVDPYAHVVFHLRPTDPVSCVTRDADITAVNLVGSGNVAGEAFGPRVMVQRGAASAPLPFNETTAVAALIRTQVMPAASAIPVILKLRRVHDFVRPGGYVKWPLYEVEMFRASDCSSTWLAVSIFGPAPVLPTTAGAVTNLATMPDVVAPYAAYYDGVDPSLMAKAAINLDAPLTFPWESNSSGQSCDSGAAIPANHLAFLGAFTTGAAVVTYRPADDAQQRPITVFRTKPGQPFKAHASVMVNAAAQTVCLRDDQRPTGTSGRVASTKLAWPSTDVTELDVIHVAGFIRLAGEVTASNFTWIASGVSTRREQAFVTSSANADKTDLDRQANSADGAVAIKALRGAVQSWSAINPLLADRTSLVMVAETLSPAQEAQGVEWASNQAMLYPVCGDRICGLGESSVCFADCPVPVPPPPPPPPPPPGTDAAVGVDAPMPLPGDAGSYDAPVGTDAAYYSPDAGPG